jgi:hypothetical protein
MPITVASCFASADLVSKGRVRWDENLLERAPGVYVLSLASEINSITPSLAKAPIDVAKIERLLAVRPYLQIDGSRATASLLAQRLSCYWLPTEPILYIGQTSKPLRSRLQQFYTTRIGERSPHAGGWWVKALTCLSDVYVHYAPTISEQTQKCLCPEWGTGGMTACRLQTRSGGPRITEGFYESTAFGTRPATLNEFETRPLAENRLV